MGSRRGRRRLEGSAQQHNQRNLDRWESTPTVVVCTVGTGLCNFLRRFRGIHKKYLAQYVAIFEWEHNLKGVTGEMLW